MELLRKFLLFGMLLGAFALSFMFSPSLSYGLQSDQESDELKLLRREFESLQHRLDVVEKLIDDVLWFHRVGLVFPHGGVHGDFTTCYTHIIRELMDQHYIVIAPEYRGSTGYGRGIYEMIDYGGLEVEDNYWARNYMIDNYSMVDKNRVGIIGWSHGGLIALMNIFDHPDDYQVAFAGVPVSDLISRMGYATQGYRELYSADYHIGKTAREDVQEYRRRSPAYNVHKFQNTPLLIHTSTNDEDVNVLEVEHLIKGLKAEGKKFEYEIFQDAPGGHSFDRLDLMLAKKIRVKIYRFLAKHLNPDNPIQTVEALMKAGYR